MRRFWTTVYAILCTILLAGGFLCTFYFAFQKNLQTQIECIIGLAMGFVLAPIIHELGHISFARANKMQIEYAKFFCFSLQRKKGKLRLGFASPFAADETQTIPQCGGDMQRRAIAYTLGGLIFSALFLLLIVGGATLTTCLGVPSFLLWGLVPYTAYLFLLNLAPLEYASGKTDTAVYLGLKKEYDAEKNMLAAMEIQGRLYAGESFAQIERELYYDVPQLADDQPLFAVMLDLRYRYHLELNETEKAGDCLNRLYALREYLPEQKMREIAAEFVYVHSLMGNLDGAQHCGTFCTEYLQSENPSAKRILAAFSAAFGKDEAVPVLLEQAENALQTESVAGAVKFEKILLSRIKEQRKG